MNNVKEFREHKGWTQHELAKKLEVSEDYVSMIERGIRNPGFSLSKKMAKILGCSHEEIFPN